jgi:hypothetical protein
MVDRDLAHDARRYREEVLAVAERERLRPGEAEVGLVHQGGAAEAPAFAAAHLAPCQLAEVGVHGAKELCRRFGVSVAGAGDELGQLGHARSVVRHPEPATDRPWQTSASRPGSAGSPRARGHCDPVRPLFPCS